MKKQILLLTLFLFSLTFISSAMLFCGDGFCDTAGVENNASSIQYCPVDCGVPTEGWCDDVYPRDCPPCTTSPCDTSRLSPSELGGWCGSNGYVLSSGTCSCPFPFLEKIAFFKITGNKCKDGLIILVVGLSIIMFILGYFSHTKKKRKGGRK